MESIGIFISLFTSVSLSALSFTARDANGCCNAEDKVQDETLGDELKRDNGDTELGISECDLTLSLPYILDGHLSLQVCIHICSSYEPSEWANNL